MKKQDIRKKYTETVTELLNQGYTIFPDTMGGSQGEIAHIDLSNGSEILRVLLEREMCSRHRDDGFDGDVVILTVGRAASDTRIRGNWDDTIWNGKLEPHFQIKWAELRIRGDGWYTDMADADRIGRIQWERYKRRNTRGSRELGDAYKSVALRWVKKQPRMKSTRIQDITRMIQTTNGSGRREFQVCVKGRWYAIR